jgi:GAF domain-containing protein
MIADEARRMTAADLSIVYLAHQNQLEIAAISGSLGKNLVSQKIPLEGSLAGRVIQVLQPLLIGDIHKTPFPFSPLIEKFSARAFLVMPLPTPVGAIGVVLVASRTLERFDKDDLRVLELLLPAASTALLNARRFVHAQALAALEERQRLSRGLQSIAAQTLFSASLIADILPRLVEINPQEGRSRMEELREITRKALNEMRSLMFDDH